MPIQQPQGYCGIKEIAPIPALVGLVCDASCHAAMLPFVFFFLSFFFLFLSLPPGCILRFTGGSTQRMQAD
jgi:hypothetical protein